MSANNITPIKRLEKDDLDNESSLPALNFFDLPESEFKKLLERRANNRLTFLSIVKAALTENVDYCTLPVRGRSSKPLPTLRAVAKWCVSCWGLRHASPLSIVMVNQSLPVVNSLMKLSRLAPWALALGLTAWIRAVAM